MRASMAGLRDGVERMTIRAPSQFRRAVLALMLGTTACAPEPFEVTEIRGTQPGPTVALVAGVHGGKRSAVAALHRLRDELPRESIRGTVLLLPVANPPAYASDLAQLGPLDSLNLNRVFPGRADGRPTERLAHRIMTDIVARSDYLVDLHGSDGEEAVGAFAYAARPGIDARVDSLALRLATLWGSPRVVWDTEGPRTVATSRFLQTAAHLSGVPAITVFEAGDTREDSASTAAFVQGARRLLAGLGVLESRDAAPPPGTPHLHARRDVTLAPSAGQWTPAIRPGQAVVAGELLGTLSDSVGVPLELRAAASGVVLHVRLTARVPSGAAAVILAAVADAPAPRS